MEKITVKELCEVVGGKAVGIGEDTVIDYYSTDSRQPMLTPGKTLFYALKGPNFDAHDYIPESEDVIPVVSRPLRRPHILVENTLWALQRHAAANRKEFRKPVVAVTGSHGKTITKELLGDMFDRAGWAVYKSPGSYNSQVGVALSLLNLTPTADVAIIEVGVGAIGDMDRLAEIVAPTHAVVVSIGNAHLAGFNGSLDAIAIEKMKLADAATEVSVVPESISETPNCRFVETDPTKFRVRTAHHGTTTHSNATVADVVAQGHRTVARDVALDAATEVMYRAYEITEQVGSLTVEVERVCANGAGVMEANCVAIGHLNSPGSYNAVNIVAATAVADIFSLPREAIEGAIATYQPAPMRLEIHTTPTGIIILNDAYISDPTSARRAISVLVEYAAGKRTVAILGDMGQVGSEAKEEHKKLGEFAAKAGVKNIFAVGAYAAEIVEGAKSGGIPLENLHVHATTADLDRSIPDFLHPGDVVLFKGRRALALEEAAATLLEPVAPTRLVVKINAVIANILAVRKKLTASTKIMAIVKSYAYGSDATKISKALAAKNVDWFAVAYPDEGIPLREAGIAEPILVMNVIAGEAEKFPRYNLAGLVSDIETAGALAAAGRRWGKDVAVHLEVDTGMQRLGMTLDACERIANEINELEGITVSGVMTHFAAADDPSEDDFTRQQIADFEAGVAKIEQVVGKRLLRHAANTSATWRFPEAHFDMVRLGIGLYGLSPSGDVAKVADFTNALRFVTKVLRVHSVDAGVSVGYNRSWRAHRRSTIATIAVGYNDGFHRYMSNGGVVLIHGQRCEVVGTVCMDTCMVDITGMEDVKLGDEVVLFGAQSYEDGRGTQRNAFLSIDEMASRGNTINYEILTGISSRVRRIYIEDDFSL